MIMKKTYRKRVEAKRHEVFEESLTRSKKGKGQVAGFDGEDAELAQEITDAASGLEEKTFRAG